MSPPVRQLSFSSGELSPPLYARTDLNRYENGLRTARNMIVMRQGGVTGRPGTKYIATTLNNGNAVRLIPFIFNETGLGQSYVLEFGDGYVTFYQDGGAVSAAPIADPYTAIGTYAKGAYATYGGLIYLSLQAANLNHQPNISPTYWRQQAQYQVFSQYAQADLSTLKYSQSADVVTITHHNYPPTELRRISATNWQFAAVTYVGTGAEAFPLTLTGGTVSANNTYYQVTAVMSNGDEGVPTHQPGGNLVASVAVPIVVSWSAVAGATFYRVYKYDIGPTVSAGQSFGYIGQTTATTFNDGDITPDYLNPPPILGPLKAAVDAGDYPSAVGYVQQRRVFANTPLNPVGVWMSAPGSPTNFNVSVQARDDDSIAFSVAGEEVNEVQSILELKFMLLLSAGAELYVQGNGSGVVTPSSVAASVQSQYGAASLKPLKVGDIILFNQALGSFVRDLSFDFAIDGYRGNDITVFASHLFERYQIVDWGYQKTPDSIVWVVRSDGVFLTCTYVREQQVLAWTRHDFSNGSAENVCCIPENGQYATYMVVNRTIDGSVVRYLERVSSRLWADDIDASYLDCFGTYDGRNESATQLRVLPTTFIQEGINDGIAFDDDSGIVNPPYTGALKLAIIAPGTYLTPLALAQAAATALNEASTNRVYSGSVSGGKVVITCPVDGKFTRFEFDPTLPYGSSDPYYAAGADNPYYARSAQIMLGFTNPGPYSMQYTATAASIPGTIFGSDSTAYRQLLAITTLSGNFFTSAMIGNEIFFQDAEFIASSGRKGSQLRLTIQSLDGASPSATAYATPNGVVPDSLLINGVFVFHLDWYLAVDVVSGLDYLEGEEVSVWADRFLVGSPLNQNVLTTYTVTGGQITLDKPYAVIYVGLPMTQDIESLDLEAYFGETMLARRKRVGSLAVYVDRTRSFFAGSENPDTNLNNDDDNPLFQLYEEKTGTSQTTYDEPPALLTTQDYVIVPSRWNKNGRIFIRNVDPVPFTLLALSPGEEDPVQGTYKRV